MQIRNLLHTRIINSYLLRVSHLRYYRSNVKIESHHTLRKLSCWIKTVGRYIFGPLPHIPLIRYLLELFNNIRNILQTDISNEIPLLFVFL